MSPLKPVTARPREASPGLEKHPLNVAFGATLRSLRKQQAISQEELAWRAGVHRTYVTNVERGVCNLSLQNIGKLAAALGKPMASLLADTESLQSGPPAKESHP